MISKDNGHDLLAIACEAVTRASKLVRTRRPDKLTMKGDRDITSDVDFAVEDLVRDYLSIKTPDIGFLGEENGNHTEDNEFVWILDPIDGTINYVHGVPLCAISLSLTYSNSTLAAVIDLPFLKMQYSALQGNGSYANERQLHTSTTTALTDALVSLDQYTFDKTAEHKNQTRLRLIDGLARNVQRLRIHGTSAIDLAWTADGRLDACVILGNKPWDTSAGVLIAREAGARVVDLDGTDHSPTSTATIAVTPHIEAQLMTIVRTALADAPVTSPLPGST